MNIYHCRLLPKVGVGAMGWVGRLNKDAQEVILQGYIQGSSIKGCLKMAVGWCGRLGGEDGGGSLVLEVACMVAQDCRESQLHLTAV